MDRANSTALTQDWQYVLITVLAILASILIGASTAQVHFLLPFAVFAGIAYLVVCAIRPGVTLPFALLYSWTLVFLPDLDVSPLPGLNPQTVVVVGLLLALTGQLLRDRRLVVNAPRQLVMAVMVFFAFYALAVLFVPDVVTLGPVLERGASELTLLERVAFAKRILTYPLIFLAMTSLPFSKRSFYVLLAVFICASLLLTVQTIGIFQVRTSLYGSDVLRARVSENFPVAIHIAILICFSLYALNPAGVAKRVLYILPVPVLVFGVLTTGFRVHILALGIGVALLVVLLRRHSLTILVLVMTALALVLIPETVVERFKWTFIPARPGYAFDESLSLRLYHLWPDGLERIMHRDNWWNHIVGDGYAGYSNRLMLRYGMFTNAHNQFLMWWGKFGIVGLLILLWFLSALFRFAWGMYRSNLDWDVRAIALSVVCSLVVALIVMNSSDLLFDRTWLQDLVFIVGALARMSPQRQVVESVRVLRPELSNR